MTTLIERQDAAARQVRFDAIARRTDMLPRSDPEYVRLRRLMFDIADQQSRYAAKNPLFFWLPALTRFHRWIFEFGVGGQQR